MIWYRTSLAVICSLVLLGGCVTIDLRSDFSEISSNVQERLAVPLFWNNGTDLDREANERLSNLLKQTLNADAAVQIGLLNNRDLQAMYSDLGIAQADLVQAGLLKNPMFDAAITFPTSGGRPDFELTAVMNLLDVLYLPLRKRIAAARFEETKARVTGVVLEFAGRVRGAFYAHQGNEQQVEFRKTVVDALSASFEVARRLHEAGNISDLDLMRERAPFERSKLALRASEAAAAQTHEQLNTLMGLWGKDTGWSIDIRLPEIQAQPPQTENVESIAIERSLDLAGTRERIRAAGEQLGFTKWTALLPDFGLGTRGERQDGPWSVGPMLEFPLAFFDQGQARVARATVGLRRAQQEYYALAVRIRSAARAIQSQMQEAGDRALYYRDILLPLQEQIVNETQLQYNAMQLGVFELIRAREQQIETASSYVQALRDYWLARSDFEQLLSGSLPRSMSAQTGQPGGQASSNVAEGH
jgi:cobalt-zinc-cadmium efflux system outer membrane protein